MKKLFITLVIFSFSLSNTLFSQNLFNIDTVRTLYLNFYDSNWNSILDSLMLADSDERILADLIVDEVEYDSVGVRYKGNSSYHPDRPKNPFNIDIDYVKDQDIYGYTKLKLANMFRDPTCIREVLSYEILRNYIPASKANFIVLYINGNLHGLYTNVESVDKDFVNKFFGSKNNSFFKCDPITFPPSPPPSGCEAMYGISPTLVIMGDDTICYEKTYSIESDYGWTELMNLIFELNNNPENIHQYLNIDRALWMLAFNNIFVNLDSYTGSGHNYYIYEDEHNRFNTIIWDMNENFGGFKHGGGQGGPLNLQQMQHLSPSWHIENPTRPLIAKLLNIPDYWKRYYAHYRSIINEFLANNAMKNRAVELQDQIDQYVLNDPNLLYTYQDFLNSLNQNIGWGQGEIYGINVLMDVRYEHLSNNPEIQKTGPVISNIQQSNYSPDANDTVWITAGITNVTNVYLAFKNELYAPFQKVQMFDDGYHYDGLANDNIFGTMVQAFTPASTVYYYIYAENNDAGMFSPERAEFECYSYLISGNEINIGDIVINEFMASNINTVPDQDGEFDDWIEFYNNTDQDIPLNGIFLSDDFADPYKWTFPDTIIPAYNFLIVWADDDEEQQGIHTNFSLNKSGEEIILSNFNGTSIDSVQFGQQYADTSFGRYPDGIGDFQFMPATFCYSNTIFMNITEIDYAENINVYPNPANDILNIEFSGIWINTEKKIELYDILMQKVNEYNKPMYQNNITIPVNNLASGIYFIRIGHYNRKVIVERK
ncbi:MAG: CotH kinase family protein [Bacteroidales bacterium]|nr:CotH kinase family protein [Bacteroidales bacterium]